MKIETRSSIVFLMFSIISMPLSADSNYFNKFENKVLCDSFRATLEASNNRCGAFTLNDEFVSYDWKLLTSEELNFFSDNSIFDKDEEKNKQLRRNFKRNVQKIEVSQFDYNNDGKKDVVFRSLRPIRPINTGECKMNSSFAEYTYYVFNESEKKIIIPIGLRYSPRLNPIGYSGRNYVYFIISRGDGYFVTLDKVINKRNMLTEQDELFSAAYISVCTFEI